MKQRWMHSSRVRTRLSRKSTTAKWNSMKCTNCRISIRNNNNRLCNRNRNSHRQSRTMPMNRHSIHRSYKRRSLNPTSRSTLFVILSFAFRIRTLEWRRCSRSAPSIAKPVRVCCKCCDASDLESNSAFVAVQSMRSEPQIQ